MKAHFASTLSPGARLVAAIAPAFTIGLDSPSPLRSTARTELKGRPVLLTPSLSRASSSPMAWQIRANRNGLEMLWMLKATRASPASNSAPPQLETQRPKWSGSAAARAGM